MWRPFLMVLLLMTHGESERQDCVQKEETDTVKVTRGEAAELVSKVPELQRCYFVLNENCCYADKDNAEDCAQSHKSSDPSCLIDYQVIIDNEVDLTCTLVIPNFSQNTTGRYKSYSNDGDYLQECLVDLADEVGGWSMLFSFIMSFSFHFTFSFITTTYICKSQACRRFLTRNQTTRSTVQIAALSFYISYLASFIITWMCLRQ